MGLSRLCDSSHDVVYVKRVLDGAMAHPEFFSTEGLRLRLTERGLTQSLADHLLKSAWEPSGGNDLRFLEKAVRSHLKRINKSYVPIRDCYYGHRLIESNTQAMFEKTNRAELGQTLDVLRQLVAGLRLFYDNGAKPRTDVRGTKALDLQSRSYLRDVVRALAGGQL
jgi:hypothetical protein